MASIHGRSASVSDFQPPSDSWVAPSPGEVKINFHSVFDKKRQGAGVCAIVRNHLGELIDGVSLFCPTGSALAAEAKAAALASRLAQAYSDKEKVVFECCSKLIVDAIVNMKKVVFDAFWMFRDDLSEAAKNCSNLKSFGWSTISKEANAAAEELCKKLVHDEIPIDWLCPPPSWVVEPPDWLNYLIAKDMPECKSN